MKCNFTALDRVASLTLWHERLGHTCHQYLKIMADKGLVQGMIVTKRHHDGPCDACHIGKQKRSPHLKMIDRGLKCPNQVVYADLLMPSKNNGAPYEAVQVIMDGFSRFVKLHLLKSKSSSIVNKYIKEYVWWALRQAGRNKNNAVNVTYIVRQVLTDKGGEFVNTTMKVWYELNGIEHIRVGPKSSQLNSCERTHQSLVEMTKAMMYHAGFPRSLWPEVLQNAVYLKNRIYNKGIQGIPYKKMFGVKPNLHNIQTFGSLAYVHVPVTPGRRKRHDNAKIGYVLGYADDVVRCKVQFLEEHTVKFISGLRVAENVAYRDSMMFLLKMQNWNCCILNTVNLKKRFLDEYIDLNTTTVPDQPAESMAGASVLGETVDLEFADLEGGEETDEIDE
ncbi:Transposon Polyprotein integrase [Phytophthora palmivora]|uniref:Transposon Polyprotein integrase n=1 Tax=Phytophthora palmivora TaxID=4796 RepID=A0A2P4XEU6_9STRA|nr:Transposon Polyprotein integrase [Phytophthora palmivora]